MVAGNNFEPMLFEISNSSGYMNMKQIPAFSQQSLFENDVYLLDNWNQIFIWVGPHSNKFEKNAAYRNADKYIAALKDGRTKEKISIVEVEATKEPPVFKVAFPNWSDQFSQTWVAQDKLAELKK